MLNANRNIEKNSSQFFTHFISHEKNIRNYSAGYTICRLRYRATRPYWLKHFHIFCCWNIFVSILISFICAESRTQFISIIPHLAFQTHFPTSCQKKINVIDFWSILSQSPKLISVDKVAREDTNYSELFFPDVKKSSSWYVLSLGKNNEVSLWLLAVNTQKKLSAIVIVTKNINGNPGTLKLLTEKWQLIWLKALKYILWISMVSLMLITLSSEMDKNYIYLLITICF